MVTLHATTGTRQGLVGLAAACLAFGLVALGSIVCRAESAPADNSKKTVTPAADEIGRIDPADPASWEASVAAARRNLDNLVDGLISIGKDEKRSDEDRRNAIFLLGAMETKESLAFLIDNIGLDLQLDMEVGDGDRLKGKPCQYAMFMGGSWKTAQAIWASLDEPKSAGLGRLGMVLGSKLGRRFARAMIDEELSKARFLTPQRRKNLEVVRRYVALD